MQLIRNLNYASSAKKLWTFRRFKIIEGQFISCSSYTRIVEIRDIEGKSTELGFFVAKVKVVSEFL